MNFSISSHPIVVKILRIVTLLCVLVVLLFGVLEIAARIWGPQLLPPDHSKDVAPGESLPGEPNMIGDALLGWRVKEGDNRQFGVPDMTHINSRGLRNSELSLEATGERRILIVGDSSIYGVRVRDTENISGQLEKILLAQGEQWTVLNGGCPGYSTWQVQRLLEERLLEYQPEWVIIGTLWSDTQGADAPDATRYGNVPLAWKYHSRLFLVAQVWYNKWRWAPKDAPKVTFGLGPVLAPTNRVPIDDYRENLYSIVEMARAHNAKTAFLLLPGIRDVIDGTTGDFREGYRLVMRDVATQTGSPIADMPAFFVGGDSRQLFYDDVHPKPIGYKMIATELHKQMFTQP